MIQVCKKKFTIKEKVPPIKISKMRDGERFNEFLVTKEEIPFCQDMGKMYKVSRKIINTKKVSKLYFSSGTAPKISQEKLKKTILELLKEYD
jgi:FlaA1/EpsC-like NDP-sugar epimerase